MRKVKKGMTLIEIVISLAIIAILLIPIMNSLLTSVRINKKSENVQDAKLLGQQAIEKLRLEDDIKAGNSINLESMVLTLGAKVPTVTAGEKEYFPVNSTGGEFNIEGKLIVDDIKFSNDIIYSNSELELCILVDEKNGKNRVKIGKRISGTPKINNYLIENDLEEREDLVSFDLDWTEVEDDILINLNKSLIDKEKYKIEVKTKKREALIYTDLFLIDNLEKHKIGLYLFNSNDINIKVETELDNYPKLYCFKSSNVFKDEFSVEVNPKINFYTNMIYNYPIREIGLYTANLEIKKDDKTIEKIESQIYLGE